MAWQISEANIRAFSDNVIDLAQQKGSKMMNITNQFHSGVTGEIDFFERVGASEAVEILSIHQDTPIIDVPHSKRRVTPHRWVWATMLDPDQTAQVLMDPMGAYTRGAGWAMGRRFDTIMIDAATGTAYSGKDSPTSVVLPAAQKVVVNASGLTKVKILDVVEKFTAAEIPEDEEKFGFISAKQKTDLLNIDEVVNRDYTAKLALESGKVAQFMGINWISTERLNLDSGGDRQVIVMTRNALGLSTWYNEKFTVNQRADKNNADQLHVDFMLGATRVEDEQVVEVACAE